MQPGDKVRAEVMPRDSFYQKVEGVVHAVRNGWLTIRATRVMSKWANEFADHPTSCMTSAKVEHCVFLEKVVDATH